MKKLFCAVAAALSQGMAVVLCSLIASSGSVPRGAGAKMAVFPDGSSCGTVGGGSVEAQVIRQALDVLHTRRPRTECYRLHPNEVQDIGMICGGEVTVYFQRLAGDDALSLIRKICAQFDNDRSSWLITVMGNSAALGVFDAQTGLTCPLAIDDLAPLLQSRAVLRQGAPAVFVEPLTQQGCVYIFGGGHVGGALCPVLAGVGFRVRVVENRPERCKPALFPTAERVIFDDFKNLRQTLPISNADYLVIMTPGHAQDFEILNQLLWTAARYIGVIGSRRKIAATNALLLSQGHSPTALARIHSPIGLAIGAQTPEEIAISIAAELIAERAGISVKGQEKTSSGAQMR